MGSILEIRMRRSRARGLPLFLLSLLVVYVLLPFFGSAWHNAAPEHEHIYLGADPFQDGSAASSELNAAAVARLGLISGPTVVHAFNPAAALQVLALVIALGALIVLVPALGRWQRLPARSLFLRFPARLPLDPPPIT